VSIVRLELRQQLDQLIAANDVLKSNNEVLSTDKAALSQAVSDVRLECFCTVFLAHSMS